ncbi:MAG TPA: RsmD family RNA methyltransferase, partial [Candidatus Berkiella sp.]|nr:RsmD family RNA methyltransferase [Candidatus Berkiella sp.]
MRTKDQGAIRIIGGKWRGRQIKVLPHIGVRPTPSRVRETVFNWLIGHLIDAQCLDLFAGSGALGFEALSRGAKKVTFV